VFCVTWRKGFRRVVSLHPATHRHLLRLLSCTLPIYDEICKRSARFILSCLFSQSSLVRSIASYGMAAKCDSVIGLMHYCVVNGLTGNLLTSLAVNCHYAILI